MDTGEKEGAHTRLGNKVPKDQISLSGNGEKSPTASQEMY